MKKTMLEYLNEVSKERGYSGWYDVYRQNNSVFVDLNYIPQEAGVRFATQQINNFNNSYGWDCVHSNDFDWIAGTQ